MDGPSFFDLFCSAFNCAPEDFSDAVFWLCLFPQALFLARLLWRVNRDFFKPDFALIREVKHTTSPDAFRSELNDFRYRNPQKGFLRGYLKMRISGQKLTDLADKLFSGSQNPGRFRKAA